MVRNDRSTALTLILIVSLVVPFAALNHIVVPVGVFVGKVAACPVVSLVAGALCCIGPEQQLAATLDALALQAERRSQMKWHLGPECQQHDDNHEQQSAQAGGGHIENATFARQAHQCIKGSSSWKQQRYISRNSNRSMQWWYVQKIWLWVRWMRCDVSTFMRPTRLLNYILPIAISKSSGYI